MIPYLAFRVARSMGWLCQALLLLWCCTPALGAAQAGEDAYRSLVDRALMELEHQNWSEARVLLERAHQLSPNAQTLRALGTTAFELRLYTRALTELEAALTHTSRPLVPEQRERVERLIEQARAFVAEVVITGIGSDAQAFVDGAPVTLSTQSTFTLDPGDHELRVVLPDGSVVRRSLRALSGGRNLVEIESQAAASAVRTMPRPEPAARPGESFASRVPHALDTSLRRRRRAWAIASTSAAGALATSSVVIGIFAKRKHDAFLDCRPDCADDVKTRGQRLQRTSIASAIATGALATSAVALWLTTPSAVDFQVEVAERTASAVARFRF